MQSAVFLKLFVTHKFSGFCFYSGYSVLLPQVASVSQPFSVREMMAWWIHVMLVLLVEGGAYTSGGDIPDHQDILRMQDRWKEYRNIVRGGFFFNDSVIALADYGDDDKDIEEQVKGDESEIRYVSEYLEAETMNSEDDSEVYSEYLDDEKDSRDIVKVGGSWIR